jgi:hypothetical protein
VLVSCRLATGLQVSNLNLSAVLLFPILRRRRSNSILGDHVVIFDYFGYFQRRTAYVDNKDQQQRRSEDEL